MWRLLRPVGLTSAGQVRCDVDVIVASVSPGDGTYSVRSSIRAGGVPGSPRRAPAAVSSAARRRRRACRRGSRASASASARYWSTSTTDRRPSASNSNGTTATAPATARSAGRTPRRRGSRSRQRQPPDAPLVDDPLVGLAEARRGPSCGRDALAVDRDEMGVATLAAARAAVTRSRNRDGAVRPALELGMGLGADVERVLVELDELDEALVRRRPAEHEAGRPRSRCGRRC